MCNSCTNNTLLTVTLDSIEAVAYANCMRQGSFNKRSQTDGTCSMEYILPNTIKILFILVGCLSRPLVHREMIYKYQARLTITEYAMLK